MNRHLTTAFLFLVVAAAPLQAADNKAAPRIKKCQDAQGKWHYGDTADDLCARSKVIELDAQGIRRKEVAAPLTDSQLKANEQKRKEAEQAAKTAEEQKRRDEQLLATYPVEADITYTRDRKIADVDVQIRSVEETLKSLKGSLARLQTQAAEEQRTSRQVSPQTAKTLSNNEQQIAKHEAAIKKMRDEKEALHVQFDNDLKRFRELKGRQTTGRPASK